MAKNMAKAVKKKTERKSIAAGIAHVYATYNNTKVTISDAQGNVVAWSSAGGLGFKGSKKSTPYVAQLTADDAGKKASEFGVRTLEVRLRGAGTGGEPAVRALQAAGFVITMIKDLTALPHNGCRARKARRI